MSGSSRGKSASSSLPRRRGTTSATAAAAGTTTNNNETTSSHSSSGAGAAASSPAPARRTPYKGTSARAWIVVVTALWVLIFAAAGRFASHHPQLVGSVRSSAGGSTLTPAPRERRREEVFKAREPRREAAKADADADADAEVGGADGDAAGEASYRCLGDDGDGDTDVFPPPSLRSAWNDLERLARSYPNAAVSGGINLYPRQGSLLTETVRRLVAALPHERSRRRVTVCETGFGSGHSAALFLSASPQVDVVTFDTFMRPYQTPALELLGRTFGEGRVTAVRGDSCETVPAYFGGRIDLENVLGGGGGGGRGRGKKNANDDGKVVEPPVARCDLLHGSSLCPTDNLDLVAHAAPCGGIPLTSTAMHSLTEEAVYFGRGGLRSTKAQWRRLRGEGCLANITCYKERPSEADRDYAFAAKGTKMEHKFCFGVTTGKCSSQRRGAAGKEEGSKKKPLQCNTERRMRDAARAMDLKEDCPHFLTEIPA